MGEKNFCQNSQCVTRSMFYKKQLIRNTSEIANQNKKQTLYISRKVRNMGLVKILVLRNKKFHDLTFRNLYLPLKEGFVMIITRNLRFMSFG